MISGIAHVFDTDGQNAHPNETGEGVFVTIRPGAFDAHLAAVRARRTAGVLLLVEHDFGRPLCSTADGTLTVWADRGALRFTVNARSRDGRRVLAAIRARPELREASVGAAKLKGTMYSRAGQDPLMLVKASQLTEISLVPTGDACYPGTKVCIPPALRAARSTAAKPTTQVAPAPRPLPRNAPNVSPSAPPSRTHAMSHDTGPSAEDRLLARLHAQEGGRIFTSGIDERAMAGLIARGLVRVAGGRARLTIAGRARAGGLAGAAPAAPYTGAGRRPLILT